VSQFVQYILQESKYHFTWSDPSVNNLC